MNYYILVSFVIILIIIFLIMKKNKSNFTPTRTYFNFPSQYNEINKLVEPCDDILPYEITYLLQQ